MKNIVKKALEILVCLLISATLARAEPAPFPEEPAPAGTGAVPGSYSACLNSNDCMVYSAPCSSPIAISNAYQPVLDSWYDVAETHMSCSRSLSPYGQWPVCVKGTCRMVP